MGRPKDVNSRRSRAERKRAQKAAEAALRLAEHGKPNAKILALRDMFSFVRAEKGGSIDQDIHDAIGQLHALGYFEDHGHDPIELRNIGRTFSDLYTQRYSVMEARTGGFEPQSRSTGGPPPRNKMDDLFDRLDDAMPRPSMERTAVRSLVIDYRGKEHFVPWAQNLINFELAKRKVPDVVVDLFRIGHDRYMLGRAVRGLCQLYDASLAPRFQRRAA